MSTVKRNRILVVLIIFAFSIFGCMNDMEHKGNWTSPKLDENFIYVPSDEGVLHKFSKINGSKESSWQFPLGDSSLGSFYGEMIIDKGILYGAAYGNGEDKRCQNRKCISSVFAIDANTGQSVWMEESIKIDGSIVGGLILHKDIIYVATSENDKSDSAGGYLYAIDAKSDSDRTLNELTQKILWRIPLPGEIYGTPLLNSEKEFLIVGGLSGDISIIDLNNTQAYETNPLSRIKLSQITNYPIISSIIKVSEDSYCFGNIKGQLKCFNLEIQYKNNSSIGSVNFQIWGELLLDGWIWSDIREFNNNYYLVTLSGWLYKIQVDENREEIKIEWEKELKLDGKPVAGLTTYTYRNQDFIAVPFDKDKIAIIDNVSGATLGEYPLKNGVQSLPIVNDNLIFVIDRDNKFRSFSVADRSQIICFDMKDMKGCD